MRLPGFIGGAYTVRDVTIDCQRCVNLHVEKNEMSTAANAEAGALVPTPGLNRLAYVGDGPIRGEASVPSTGKLIVVSGSGVYLVESDWSSALVGRIRTSTGPVDIASNLYQVCIVDGVSGYAYDTTKSPAFFEIAGFPACDRAAFLDNYVLFNIKGSGSFGFTALNDISVVDPLDVQTVEGSPDNLIGVVVSNRQIWLPGTDSVEVFINTGDALNPFQRVQGAFVEFGCASSFTFQKIGNSVVWLGSGTAGAGIVWMATGYQPTRISTHAIEFALSSSGDLSSATAYVYQQGGHQFYCLTVPGQATTWVYDLATGLWHERVGFLLGDETRHRAQCQAYAYGVTVVGDYQDGRIYKYDYNQMTDDGEVIIRERTTPHLGQDGRRLIWDYLQVEAKAGVGSSGGSTNADPQMMLQWSNDAGVTWSPERWVSFGKIGQFLTRAIWRRMGFSRYRVFRVRVSSSVPVFLLGASIQFRVGGN